jgi:carbon monoxide dehydrogenase subunit G
MKFENTFAVAAPIAEVWETLMDVERVAPCMPGAEVLERVGDDSYKVAVKVKLGPMTMQYRGQVEIVERDDQSRQATMRAKAKEARGQGTADAHVRMALAEEQEGTLATISTELQMSGKAAAMGQGVIGDVAARLVEMFAANLAEMLAGEPAPRAGAPSGVPPPSAGPSTAAPSSEPPGATATAETPVATATAPAATAQAPPVSEDAGGPSADSGALPVADLVASVVATRLRNPRTLLIVLATLAALSGAIGFAIGRRRRT